MRTHALLGVAVAVEGDSRIRQGARKWYPASGSLSSEVTERRVRTGEGKSFVEKKGNMSEASRAVPATALSQGEVLPQHLTVPVSPRATVPDQR